MNFSCSVCNCTSDIKQTLVRHINKKTRCGEGIPKILEIPVDIKCDYCEKNYNTQPSLKRHLKTCKVKKEAQTKEINELKTKLAVAEAKIETLVENPQTINNNNVNINIQLNGYRETDFSKLKDAHFSRALSRALMSVPQLIEYTHFNNQLPENHNIYISNQKGKYAMVYNGQNWEIKDQAQTIDKLITDHEYELEQWVEGKCEGHPKEMEKFQRYLEIKENSEGAEEQMKEEVRMMLYNKRKIVKR